MISFIVIGRNEGWKITKCFRSIFNTIAYNNLTAYEVIYIDSQSTDDSIKRAKEFNGVWIYKLTVDFNAAIARNMGVYNSKGDVLFFIDGDMEIIPEFLPLVYDERNGLKYEFVSGQFEDYYYSQDGAFICKKLHHRINSDEKLEYTVGGLFLIKRRHWEMIHGMKNYLRISQDIDLGIRLAGAGIMLKRRKELLAIHHTIKYQDRNRIWTDFLKGNGFYRSILLRENFMNPFQQRIFFRENYSLFVLGIVIVLVLITDNILPGIIYFGAIGLRSIKNAESTMLDRLNLFIYYFLRDLCTFGAFLFFWPKKEKNIKIKEIT